MPDWKQIVPKPAGALPANLMNRVVAILAVVLVVVIVAATIGGGAGSEEDTPDPTQEMVDQGAVDADVEDRLGSEVENQRRQAAFELAQEELDAQREAVREANLNLLQPDPDPGQSILERLAGITPEEQDNPWESDVFSPEEAELRLKLHLESIERRQRSLLAAPVAHSVRDADAAGVAAATAAEAAPASRNRLDNLYDAISAAARQQQSPVNALLEAATEPRGGTLDVPLPDSNNLPTYQRPERVVAPDDPDGFHRIHEGSFVEAILVTQLSGDFPSPVAAVVAVPFYSADRQTVLIPRGSRFIGTVQAVRDQNQSRLAVGFHRLVFPDGRWAALRFQGLNQIGEGALKDQVDRHYLSTFLAAGGVGLLSGLAAAGTNPYAGTQEQFQLGAARSFSETGMQIMDRFLNRLPTITIRAGHRLRVWFTADLLLPPQSTGVDQ
ncbi:MAG: TrbI/VirB10 family protein [Acidobacteria bacterium]|nr:TrbI/VirB10 family protein [Acidobacteriota bacterium]MCY3971592.1 TrbI/VirB10 family protein [Acidobacteriota bacterium]